MSLKAAIRAGVEERAKQDNQAIKEENNHDSKVASDHSSEIAKNQDSKIETKAIEVETPAENSAESAELVGLNIRVPKAHRLHWLIAAKREGSSMTAAVNEALAARYGLPSDEK